ncbi:hypothetical protein DXG01_009257 [Tephrocybe rancida]|nr:hypothetical protein DXG01_009257 [Tephrocybe rancida]
MGTRIPSAFVFKLPVDKIFSLPSHTTWAASHQQPAVLTPPAKMHKLYRGNADYWSLVRLSPRILSTLLNPPRLSLVGAVGSGKSTIVKQMKIHHCGHSPQELLEHRRVIYENLLEAAQAGLTCIYRLDHDYATAEYRALADTVLAYRVEGLHEFDQEVAKAIHKLWIGMPGLRIFIGIKLQASRLVESAS